MTVFDAFQGHYQLQFKVLIAFLKGFAQYTVAHYGEVHSFVTVLQLILLGESGATSPY